MRKILLSIYYFCLINTCFSQTIYINPEKGSNSNIGSQQEPLKTLGEGVKRINQYSGDKPLILKLEPGLYVLDNNLTIEYNNSFTQENPLIIEASILPDYIDWTMEKMPVVISTALPEKTAGDICTYSLRVETNHTTVRGIKFLSNPSIYTKHFCIYRTNDTLTSLKVSQCLFLGDRDIMPVQVAVMVNGHGTEVEHCVFSNCRWAAIFFYADGWKNPVKNSSMHHCIVTDCYLGAVWTSLVDSDFQFYNNIVNKCKFFWIKNYFNKATYTIENCVVSDVDIYNGEWQKGNKKIQGDYKFIEKNITRDGIVHLIKWDDNQPFVVDKNFMHVTKDSLGYSLNAGIFKSNNR